MVIPGIELIVVKTSRLTVGLVRPKDTGSLISLGRLYDNIEFCLGKFFNVINFSSAEEDSEAIDGFEALHDLEEYLAQVDVILGLDSQVFKARETQNRNIPILLFALGSMPRGGLSILGISRFLRSTDSILFSSKADLSIFRSYFKNHGVNSHLVPFGIDSTKFKPMKNSRSFVEEKLSISGNSRILLFAGRINVQKNLHTLLKMYESVNRARTNVVLVIVGGIDSIPVHEFEVSCRDYLQYLQELVYRYEMDDRVFLTGRVDDLELIRFYSGADVFVNCTIDHGENFGFAQVEAMACGTPVVCSKWGGLKDTIIHGNTGFHINTILTNNGVKVHWFEGRNYILHLLDHPRALDLMPSWCVEHVRERYSLQIFAQSLRRIIQASMDRRSQSWSRTPVLYRYPHHIQSYLECIKKDESRKKHFVDFRPFYRKIYQDFVRYYASKTETVARSDKSTMFYFLTDTRFNEGEKVVEALDPIWPREYKWSDWEFETLLYIKDGKSSTEIMRNLQKKYKEPDASKIEAHIRKMLAEGIIAEKANFKAEMVGEAINFP